MFCISLHLFLSCLNSPNPQTLFHKVVNGFSCVLQYQATYPISCTCPYQISLYLSLSRFTYPYLALPISISLSHMSLDPFLAPYPEIEEVESVYKKQLQIARKTIYVPLCSDLKSTWEGRSALPLIGHRLCLPVGGACIFGDVSGGEDDVETFAAVSVSQKSVTLTLN